MKRVQTENFNYFYQKRAQKQPFWIFFLEKNNRPGGWKQGAVLPEKSVFNPRNDEISLQNTSFSALTSMLLYRKSMHISLLKQCFWENKTDERIAIYSRNAITSCVITRYKCVLFLAYLKPNALLLANNEILKGMFVKKNVSVLGREDSSWHLAARAKGGGYGRLMGVVGSEQGVNRS